MDRIPGARDLVEWFGEWPSFHDAEVIAVCLNRTGESSVRVDAWRRTNRVDAKGYYIREKHAIVIFYLTGVTELDLCGFSRQNVIFGLDVHPAPEGFVLSLDPCYGLSGSIVAEEIRVGFEPVAGPPADVC